MRSTTCCRKALSLWLFRRCSVWDRWIIGADYHPRHLWEDELSHGKKEKPPGCKGGFSLWLQLGWVTGDISCMCVLLEEEVEDRQQFLMLGTKSGLQV